MHSRKYVEIIIFLLVVVVFILGIVKFASAPELLGEASQNTSKIYQNKEFGFEVKYPSGFTVHDEVFDPTYSRVNFTGGNRVNCPIYSSTVDCFGPHIFVVRKVYPTGLAFADVLSKVGIPKEEIYKESNFSNQGLLQIFDGIGNDQLRYVFIWNSKNTLYTLGGTDDYLNLLKGSFRLLDNSVNSKGDKWNFEYSVGGALDYHGTKLEINSDGIVNYWYSEHGFPLVTDTPTKHFKLESDSIKQIIATIDEFYFNNQTDITLQNAPDAMNYYVTYKQGDTTRNIVCPYKASKEMPYAGSLCRPKVFELQNELSRILSLADLKLK